MIPLIRHRTNARGNVGEWFTLDLGIGAVGGAVIAGAVAIYLDQRRRRDERKNSRRRIVGDARCDGIVVLRCC
jgi:hypothetical protein